MAGQTDESHGRDAMRLMRQVLVEMVEYMPDAGANSHKARWERMLTEAAEEIDAIRIRHDQPREERRDLLRAAGEID